MVSHHVHVKYVSKGNFLQKLPYPAYFGSLVSWMSTSEATALAARSGVVGR